MITSCLTAWCLALSELQHVSKEVSMLNLGIQASASYKELYEFSSHFGTHRGHTESLNKPPVFSHSRGLL